MRSADLQHTDLTAANLCGADLSDTDLKTTILKDANVMHLPSGLKISIPNVGAIVGGKIVFYSLDTLLLGSYVLFLTVAI